MDEMSPNETDLDKGRVLYKRSLASFTDELERCLSSSYAAAGIVAGDRRFWASVLFTRLCTMGTNILWLCPRSKVNLLGKHWDFTSVGSLTRNLYECVLFYMYFTAECPECEWRAKLKLMQLHDSVEREKMLSDLEIPQHGNIHEELREPVLNELKTNEYFLKFSEKQQKEFLKGKTPAFQLRTEIAVSLGLDIKTTGGIYRLLSSHVHSFPLGFYRVAEHKRTGPENAVDVTYSGMSLELGTYLLQIANERYRELFGDKVVFKNIAWRGNSHFGGAAPDSSSAKVFDRNALCPCNSGQKFRWCHGKES